MNFENTTALITGGSTGIGAALAEGLIARGAHVTITARREGPLAAAAERLGCDAIAGDVGDPETAESTVRSVVDKHGRLDLLVNNAGWGRFGMLVDTDPDDFLAVHRTNVFGAFLMGQAAAKQFIAQGSGHLVNISSTAGTKGFAGGTAYASSKFALKGMTECWRDELRKHNVRVMLVNPSEVMTNFAANAGYDQAQSEKKLRAQEIADAILGALAIDDRGFIPEFSVFATNPFE
ncbi:MAG: SDR family oxidoreductase [Planctomycetota bacterium]|jgi:3-oxoacyl-[acyl-carrier protein] reductase